MSSICYLEDIIRESYGSKKGGVYSRIYLISIKIWSSNESKGENVKVDSINYMHYFREYEF